MCGNLYFLIFPDVSSELYIKPLTLILFQSHIMRGTINQVKPLMWLEYYTPDQHVWKLIFLDQERSVIITMNTTSHLSYSLKHHQTNGMACCVRQTGNTFEWALPWVGCHSMVKKQGQLWDGGHVWVVLDPTWPPGSETFSCIYFCENAVSFLILAVVKVILII